jgi:hypothetical protein
MSSAAIGSPVRFARLPADLRELVMRHREAGPDPARGVLWFANGDEISLTVGDAVRRAAPALAMFGAAGAGVLAHGAFSDGDASRWLWTAAAGVLVAVSIGAGVRAMTRNEKAVRRFDLGTWLFPHALVLVSYGRHVVLPRAQITRAGVDSTGTDGERERFVAVFYRAENGVEKPLHLTGFLGDAAAVAALTRWVATSSAAAAPSEPDS